MKILALDTATESCNVGVWVDGTVHEREIPGRQHAEQLLSLIRELMAESGLALAELDAIAFGRGPGMFTGLRIGAGITQGLAFALDLPVVPVSSLAAIAHGCDGENIIAAIDARMDQVYWCAFRRRDGTLLATTAEQVTNPNEIQVESDGGWIGCGSGWDRYGDTMADRLGDRFERWLPGRTPRARDIAALGFELLHAGGAVAPEDAVPVYVRDEVARKPGAA
ncbi:MAG: tRNA (adenosine(37)-N6)-threonylcarbamoyltransferase complex dimerization subunit type 1 TsaB [Acidiferrobacteraceae bacterium]|jgi:tRNA threonylcarbamoyladenosine biosynthesis protein TsaB